jgi:hypothetical protein
MRWSRLNSKVICKSQGLIEGTQLDRYTSRERQ